MLDTIRRLTFLGVDKVDTRKTTLMITNKLEVMQMCDRILAVDEVEIVEDSMPDSAK